MIGLLGVPVLPQDPGLAARIDQHLEAGARAGVQEVHRVENLATGLLALDIVVVAATALGAFMWAVQRGAR